MLPYLYELVSREPPKEFEKDQTAATTEEVVETVVQEQELPNIVRPAVYPEVEEDVSEEAVGEVKLSRYIKINRHSGLAELRPALVTAYELHLCRTLVITPDPLSCVQNE